MNNSVISIKSHPRNLAKIIRELAKERQVFLGGDHTMQRQSERSHVVEITDQEIYRVLELGEMKGSPRRGENDGEWIVKMAFSQKGAREIGVLTAVIDADHDLFILTAEWEDR